MLQVGKIQQTALPLCCQQTAVVIKHQREQRLNARAQKADVLGKFLLIGTEQLFCQLCHHRLR